MSSCEVGPLHCDGNNSGPDLRIKELRNSFLVRSNLENWYFTQVAMSVLRLYFWTVKLGPNTNEKTLLSFKTPGK